MTRLYGKIGSKGYSSGNAIVKDTLDIEVTRRSISKTDINMEIARFRDAQEICDANLAELIEKSKKTKLIEAVEIFNAYRSIIHDEAFYKNVFRRVRDELVNIEYILDDECKKAVQTFSTIKSDYFKERAIDIENVCNELIHLMMGVKNDFSDKMAGANDVILVAYNLTPAETVKLDKSILRAIVTEIGGVTSHTVILAKSIGIPAIVGVSGAVQMIRSGDFIMVDGFKGELVLHPDEQAAREFADAKRKYDESKLVFESAERLPAITSDGFAVNVTINSGGPSSLETINSERCDGVGLLRTEFIYMHAEKYPDENKQFEIYKDVVTRVNGKAVVIRTVDMGGDKQADYMDLSDEENPALGFRAIRFCLYKKDIFSVQLRAILRASAFGNIKIMFPMICCLEELLEAKSCVEAEKQKLREENIPFREDIPIGIMVETPAAVILSDKLAQYADFFSIGTNDLIQYTVAADRANVNVASLYDHCNISVLRLIKLVADNAEKAGVPWGICGEAASEERLVPLWVAMGAKELSVAPSSVGTIKHIIGRISRGAMLKELDTVLDCENIADVREHLDNLALK